MHDLTSALVSAPAECVQSPPLVPLKLICFDLMLYRCVHTCSETGSTLKNCSLAWKLKKKEEKKRADVSPLKPLTSRAGTKGP